MEVDGVLVTRIEGRPYMLYGIAEHVRLRGTPGRDRSATAACRTSVIHGLGGDDQLVPLGDRATPNSRCGRRRMVAHGGRGDDYIVGTL